jgi:hypothetical protein
MTLNDFANYIRRTLQTMSLGFPCLFVLFAPALQAAYPPGGAPHAPVPGIERVRIAIAPLELAVGRLGQPGQAAVDRGITQYGAGDAGASGSARTRERLSAAPPIRIATEETRTIQTLRFVRRARCDIR